MDAPGQPLTADREAEIGFSGLGEAGGAGRQAVFRIEGVKEQRSLRPAL